MSSDDLVLAGFVGYDYIREVGLKGGRYTDFVRLVDTEIAPCRMVVAAPEGGYSSLGDLRKADNLRVGSKYPYTAKDYLERRDVKGVYVERSGTIEGMPTLDESDIIVDIENTGGTLRRNQLRAIKEMFDITVGLYTTNDLYSRVGCGDYIKGIAERRNVSDIGRRIQESVNAKKKIWVEVNVPSEYLKTVVNSLPAMKSPTIAELVDRNGFGVKAVVDIDGLFELMLKLERLGATDMVTYPLQSVGIQGTYVPRQLSEEDLQH